MNDSEASFYATQSHWTDPGEFGRLYPAVLRVDEMAEAGCRLVWHQGWLRRHDADPPSGSETDIDQRLVRVLLSRVLARDGRPLTERRAGSACYIGTCRDTAILACSLFRHHHVPARLRAGFAGYFKPG